MNRIILLALIVLLFVGSCKTDCPDKKYYLNIALANNTEFEIDVSLYPKQDFLEGENFYQASNVGSGYSLKGFSIEAEEIQMWSFKHVIYQTNNTSLKPTLLLNQVFDSIYFIVKSRDNTEIILLPDTSINYMENPFTNDSIWTYQLINSDTPNNDCPNPSETLSYRFYIEQDLINN